jgi:hypothetical protein
MSEVPTKDAARDAMERAERSINFSGPDFRMLEEWLGWRRFQLGMSVLAERDDQLAEKLYGQAHMCQELILMIQNNRKVLQPQP